MGPANQTLPINTIAVLPCQASGNPKPSIRWFRDQKPITEMDSSSRLMVEETGTLVIDSKFNIDNDTGKSFSEALILVSTNPQYDKRLLIELRVQYMKIPSSEHVENMLYTQIVFCFDIQNNLCTQHVLSLEFSCTELVIQ